MFHSFFIRNGRTYDPMIDRSRVRSLHTEILVRSFRTLKINTTSCCVNHVYTLPPKLSSVINKFRPGSIFCVFASVASILIEYWKKEKRITLAPVEENGPCSSDHIQWRIIRNYIMYKGHARTNLFSDTKENKNASSSLSEYSSAVFVYTGFGNSATTLTLLCNSSCSNLIGRPGLSRNDGGGLTCLEKKQDLFFHTANGVNSSIRIYCFESTASLWLFMFSVKSPLEAQPCALSAVLCAHQTPVWSERWVWLRQQRWRSEEMRPACL